MSEHNKKSAVSTLERAKANLNESIQEMESQIESLESKLSNTRRILGTIETMEQDELRKANGPSNVKF